MRAVFVKPKALVLSRHAILFRDGSLSLGRGAAIRCGAIHSLDFSILLDGACARWLFDLEHATEARRHCRLFRLQQGVRSHLHTMGCGLLSGWRKSHMCVGQRSQRGGRRGRRGRGSYGFGGPVGWVAGRWCRHVPSLCLLQQLARRRGVVGQSAEGVGVV